HDVTEIGTGLLEDVANFSAELAEEFATGADHLRGHLGSRFRTTPQPAGYSPGHFLVTLADLLLVRLDLACHLCLRRLVRLQEQGRSDTQDGTYGEGREEVQRILA